MQDFSEILGSLNPEQRRAAEHTEGPLLVLAGAGTGKTTVLTTRVANILFKGAAFPSQILVVTFTNKAAREMEHRIRSMVGEVSAGLWLGTFHSICLRIIRKHYSQVGLKENFSIINQDDQLRLLKDVMKQLNIDEKKNNPKAIQAQINRWKDRALLPEDVVDGDIYSQTYEAYQKRCEELNIIDFGDLILKVIILFKTNSEVLAEYHRRFKYILVDEYQDTNVAQYLWLRLLAQGSHNICCVGDDDQSIYGWRGAEVGNILRFEKDFFGAQIIRLETNYRSTSDILDAADKLIANNQSRLGKNLKAFHGEGEKVKLVSIWDDRAEANYIADEIESLQQLKRVSLDNVAILVRAGYQTRAFEECFMRRAIPYRILGGLRFYERMEIRDAIAYIRAVVHSQNDLALERIINLPKRGLGDKTIEELKMQARLTQASLNMAIRSAIYHKALKPKINETLTKLINNFDRWKEAFLTQKHAEVVEKILEESGYIDMWRSEKTVEAQGRVENLKELFTAIAEFDDIEHFLEHVSLVSDSDDRPLEDMVSVMTIHGAKGLEFENVFLPGWEEGLFPSQQTLDDSGKEGLEEERRLAYVGITRAKRRLTISFTASRMVFGNIISSIPSRFVDELPEECVEAVNKLGSGPGYRRDSTRLESFRAEKTNFGRSVDDFLQQKALQRKEIPSAENNYGEGLSSQRFKSKFRVGDKIVHGEFGRGRVVGINGRHVQIVFERSSMKTLLEDFIEAESA